MDCKSFTSFQEFIPLLGLGERHTNGQCSLTGKDWEATAKLVAVQRTSMMQSSAL